MYKINRQKAENKSGKTHNIYIEKQTTLVKTMEKRKVLNPQAGQAKALIYTKHQDTVSNY